MSSLKRIRNGSLSGLVYRFVFKLDGLYSRFAKSSERRFAYSSDRKLSLIEIEDAALAVTRFYALEGSLFVTVFDETRSSDDDDYEVVAALVDADVSGDSDFCFSVLSSSISV